jgi:GT2 family glycosyltransferase
MTTRLTLGICTFNRGPAIVQTLEAICAMSRVNGRVAELVVIDNASTDDTPAIVDEFIARAASTAATPTADAALPIRRVVEPRQGLAQARRRLIEEARTELVAFLDDDVLPDPTWAEAMIRVMDQHPRCGVAGGKVRLKFETGPTKIALRYASFLARQDLGETELLVSEPTRSLVGAAMCLRKPSVIATGWLESQSMPDRQGATLSSGGDNELCIRLRRSGFEIRYTPAAIVDHLIPERRQTVEYLAKLGAGIGSSIPFIKLLAHDAPTPQWAQTQLRLAQTRQARAMIFEWRREYRPIRLAEHEGRVEGWRRVLETLSKR